MPISFVRSFIRSFVQVSRHFAFVLLSSYMKLISFFAFAIMPYTHSLAHTHLNTFRFLHSHIPFHFIPFLSFPFLSFRFHFVCVSIQFIFPIPCLFSLYVLVCVCLCVPSIFDAWYVYVLCQWIFQTLSRSLMHFKFSSGFSRCVLFFLFFFFFCFEFYFLMGWLFTENLYLLIMHHCMLIVASVLIVFVPLWLKIIFRVISRRPFFNEKSQTNKAKRNETKRKGETQWNKRTIHIVPFCRVHTFKMIY